MKKSYFFLSSLMLLATVGFSQSLLQNSQATMPAPRLTPSEHIPALKRGAQQKAPPAGATIFFYEDCDTTGTTNGLPPGWNAFNATANNNDWIWSDAPPGGQYSTNIPALNSSTGSNGYLLLPCDLYNTPFPMGGPAAMDAWVVSPSFSIGAGVSSVIVDYTQSNRYCCLGSNELVLEVSTNGTNWSVPYNAIGGRAPNTATPNGLVSQINVSAELANQTTGYIRFRSTGNSHYYWMIDDIYVFEGPDNQMEMVDYSLKFHSKYDITPIYKTLPIVNLPEVTYTGISQNTGGNTLTNAKFRVDVTMDSTMSGGPGLGLVYQDSAVIDPVPAPAGVIPSLQRDTTEINSPFFSFNAGWYTNRLYLTSDSSFASPAAAEANYQLALTTDTTIALDRGELFFQGSSGPPSYVGGGNDNDAAAALMILDSVLPANVHAFSVSVFMANRADVVGLQISPRIWGFDEDQATLTQAIGPLVASSPFSTTITAAQQGTWVSLPIFPPVFLTPDSAYYFGVEQTGGANIGAELWLGRDVGQEDIAPIFSNAYFLNEPGTPRWIAPDEILGIRFHGDFGVGLEESSVERAFSFEVFPNPNDGLMKLQMNSKAPTTFQMNVRNTVGQTVLSEAINVNGAFSRDLDLSSFDKGIYFITLENGKERNVKKIVVQ